MDDLLQVCSFLYPEMDEERIYEQGWALIQCPSPEHDDLRPSCRITRRWWHCYSCGREGGIVSFAANFIAKQNNSEIEEYDGLLFLAEIEVRASSRKVRQDFSSISIKESPAKIERYRVNAQRFFYSLNQPCWDRIHESYLQKRGFSQEILRELDVRINGSSCYPYVMPIIQDWQFKGYVARADKDDNPIRYMFNKGFQKSETVYVPNQHLERGEVMVVEGYLDAVKTYQFGYKNVACIFGWHVADAQITYIREHATTLVWATDNDERGEEGYKRAKNIFTDIPVKRFCSEYKDNAAIQSQIEFDIALIHAYM